MKNVIKVFEGIRPRILTLHKKNSRYDFYLNNENDSYIQLNYGRTYHVGRDICLKEIKRLKGNGYKVYHGHYSNGIKQNVLVTDFMNMKGVKK